MKRNWKRTAICAAIALASVIITLSLGQISFFQLLSLKAQDAHFVLRGKMPTKDIVLIEMDEKANDKFSEPQLFWQPYYADAIQGAADAGAKVMVVDNAFLIPVRKWKPDNDSALAAAYVAVNQKMPVVLAFVASNADQKDPDFAVPVNILASTFGTAAMPVLTADRDDFVRRQVLIETPQAGVPTESLKRSMSFLAAEKFLGVTASVRNGHVYLGNREIPTDDELSMTINYAGPTDTFDIVSMYDFVTAVHAGNKAQLEKWVKGKAVLLGTDSREDRRPTPFYTAFGSSTKWTMPGVEIWANSLNTLLTGDFLQPVPEWARIAALIAVAGTTIVVVAVYAVSLTAIWSLTVLAVALIFTHVLFRAGWLLNSFEVMEAFLYALIGGVIYRRATAEKKSHFFKNAVALFVGKDVAKSLDQSEQIGLTGKREMVTIMFSDIRGFTAFCESKDPAIIVDLLNVYMATMCKIIVSHHGHVNKFIGDGILAVFTDSDEGAEPGGHAARAIRCATDMVNAPSQFKTGTGMHSGEVVIGNVGSSDKMEFTVLGDTVNLASRLESLNKEHKTNLLMSGSTHDLAGDAIETVYLGAVPVRGKTEPMKLYTAASLMTDDIRHVHHMEEGVSA